MSGRGPADGRENQPPQPPTADQPPSDKGKKKVKIRKRGKWVEVEGDVVQKGRFKYVEFTDDDGLDTWWIVPPQ
jgi:hypothetical protein